MSPIMSKLISVSVAMRTPVMIGTRLKYTVIVCFSFIMIRDRTTVKRGIVAFTIRDKENINFYDGQVEIIV